MASGNLDLIGRLWVSLDSCNVGLTPSAITQSSEGFLSCTFGRQRAAGDLWPPSVPTDAASSPLKATFCPQDVNRRLWAEKQSNLPASRNLPIENQSFP